ncbi:hypothetical protein ACFCXS_31990 [Streptomyces sp. NPDC056373]|uniref:hypothetical protein n=1 Tax=Streptomyces sp. NPDC056373 TaxID=3345798 RepID=UPI0035D81F85
MSASGTAVVADGTGGAGSPGPAPSGGRKVVGSVLWALLVPALLLLGAVLGQWMTWAGVVVALAVIAVAACVVGGSWHRAGAATLVSFGGFALMLFAGPAAYEAYMQSAGEPVDAVVTQVADRDQRRGPDMSCTVRELGGKRTTYEVSQQENCFGQARPGDRVEIRKDPLGLLGPRLPDSPDQRNTTEITLAVTAALTLLVAGGTLYGGLRRRG